MIGVFRQWRSSEIMRFQVNSPLRLTDFPRNDEKVVAVVRVVYDFSRGNKAIGFRVNSVTIEGIYMVVLRASNFLGDVRIVSSVQLLTLYRL